MMSKEIAKIIPNNLHGKIIFKQNINLLNIELNANEMQECTISGDIINYDFSTNLISCNYHKGNIKRPFHDIDAKNTIFSHLKFLDNFSDNFITKCTFKNVDFLNSTLYNTTFTDCIFLHCSFERSNLIQTTFKDNYFDECKFVDCKTSNKIFEHCIFANSYFERINFKIESIVQNFGIKSDYLSECKIDNKIINQQTLNDFYSDNDFENFNVEYFKMIDFNTSRYLDNIVSFNFNFDISFLNYNFIFVYISQFAKFINILYEQNNLIAYFPLKLYLSLESAKEQIVYSKETSSILENLTVASILLEKFYKNLLIFNSRQQSISLLTFDDITKEDVSEIIEILELNLDIIKFEKYNSPNLVDIASQNAIELSLFLAFIFASNFNLEVSKYIDNQKLLLLETNLDTKKKKSISYEVLFMLNAPNAFTLKMGYRLNLSHILKLRKMFLQILNITEKN